MIKCRGQIKNLHAISQGFFLIKNTPRFESTYLFALVDVGLILHNFASIIKDKFLPKCYPPVCQFYKREWEKGMEEGGGSLMLLLEGLSDINVRVLYVEVRVREKTTISLMT